jgi:hypothetical protein
MLQHDRRRGDRSVRKRTKRRQDRRGHPTPPADGGEAGQSAGSGSFLGQIGLFETPNGLAHGLAVIPAAIVAALVIYPITRLVQFLARR